MFSEWGKYGIYLLIGVLIILVIFIMKWEREFKQRKETRILPKLRKPKFLKRFKFYKDEDEDDDEQSGSDKDERL